MVTIFSLNIGLSHRGAEEKWYALAEAVVKSVAHFQNVRVYVNSLSLAISDLLL